MQAFNWEMMRNAMRFHLLPFVYVRIYEAFAACTTQILVGCNSIPVCFASLKSRVPIQDLTTVVRKLRLYEEELMVVDPFSYLGGCLKKDGDTVLARAVYTGPMVDTWYFAEVKESRVLCRSAFRSVVWLHAEDVRGF